MADASLLQVAAESVGSAVFVAALLTQFYNHLLSSLRESHVKKASSLLVHPLAISGGIGHGIAMAQGWPTTPIPAILGWLVVLWVLAVRLRQIPMNARWRRRPVPLRESAIRWKALPAPARLIFRSLAMINEVGRLEIVERRLTLANLPAEFVGRRIVFLTDFHVHKWMRPAWYREVVDRAMELQPDLLLIGGDLVSRKRFAPAARRILSGMARAPLSLAVRGNHDFWTRPAYHAATLRRWGAVVLRNEVHHWRIGAAELKILGVESPYIPISARQRQALIAALAQGGGPVIGLVHTPQTYPLAAELGCDFAFAGHTHGGQVRLPFFGTTISSCPGPADRLWGAGRIPRSGRPPMETFTSNGVGAFYPLRLLCPPQIVVVTLHTGRG